MGLNYSLPPSLHEDDFRNAIFSHFESRPKDNYDYMALEILTFMTLTLTVLLYSFYRLYLFRPYKRPANTAPGLRESRMEEGYGLNDLRSQGRGDEGSVTRPDSPNIERELEGFIRTSAEALPQVPIATDPNTGTGLDTRSDGTLTPDISLEPEDAVAAYTKTRTRNSEM